MAIHRQHKSINPLEIKDQLENIVYSTSKQARIKQAHIIDCNVCQVDSKRSKSGLERYLSRQNKSAKIIFETLTGSV
jgi:hypothetical protein